MKTRRFAQAEDDPELAKTAKLASFLRDLCNTVMEAKGMFLIENSYFNKRLIFIKKKKTYLR